MHNIFVIIVFVVLSVVASTAAPKIASPLGGCASMVDFPIIAGHGDAAIQAIASSSLANQVLNYVPDPSDSNNATVPLKVLLISVHPPHGGGSAHSSRELAVGLRSLGHTVVHVAPYAKEDPNIPNEQYADLLWMQANFPWDTLDIQPEAQNVMDSFIAKVYAERGPFDVAILGRESMLWHLPALRKIHGPAPIIAVVRGAYINRLVSEEKIEPSLRERLLNLYRSADRIVCIARHLTHAVIHAAGPSVAQKTHFLSNPINIPIEIPSESLLTADALNRAPTYLVDTRRRDANETIRLIMPAQLKSRKRPIDAIEAMNLLVNVDKLDVHLTVCGSGPDAGRMRTLIAEYGLENRVLLKGHVKREEVLAVMKESETVLLFSDNEGRPRVLQEAIAAGKGVVAYDTPGSHEVLNEWGHDFAAWPIGRLVPIGDVEGARRAIANLAAYFRSEQHAPLRVTQPPSSLEVLHDWDRSIRQLL
eukprot:TRINITY_DN1504_c0_g1_i2.p1 TRINITY_DN1504_c0_g1~~TRINITY_DN1504_c0_g1_i2.p1  ORF type:complete len:477 (-),score=50.58 TRINITY_DN1504_c0_g1_i2:1263-2693(-)